MSAQSKKLNLLALSGPILIEVILRNLMGTVNVFLLSKYSDDAVAAVGVANQITNVVIIAFSMIAAGASVLINQYLGAGEDKEAGRTTSNAISACFLLGLIVSAAFICFSSGFIKMLALDSVLVQDATVYLRIMGGVSLSIALSSMLSAAFRCHGNTFIPMLVVIINNVVNFLGTALVIFRPFETPLYGVEGVAIMRALSEVVGLAVLIVLIIRANYGIKMYDMLHISLKRLKAILRIGLMSGMEGISYTLGQVVTTRFLAGFSTAALSAKVYVQTVDFYAYLVGRSLGEATQIISGHMIGGGDEKGAFRLVNRSYVYVLLLNMLFGLGFYFLSTPILRLFTEDPEIISIGRTLLLIDVFIHMGRAFNHTFNWGLRSAGYVFWPMIIAVSSIWIFNVGGGYVFSNLFALGVIGLWVSQALDEWVRGIFNTYLWFSKKWMHKKILEHE